MNCTVLLSVVTATMCTGEVTVELGAGVQMVTDGFTVLAVHPPPPPPPPLTVMKIVCLK